MRFGKKARQELEARFVSVCLDLEELRLGKHQWRQRAEKAESEARKLQAEIARTVDNRSRIQDCVREARHHAVRLRQGTDSPTAQVVDTRSFGMGAASAWEAAADALERRLGRGL